MEVIWVSDWERLSRTGSLCGLADGWVRLLGQEGTALDHVGAEEAGGGVPWGAAANGASSRISAKSCV